ncbi:MAG TPA: TIGR03862 family flavoprotein [Bacteroidia bacterium]|jgi:hypothetical protein|nr:TIGR03862 family flavoprotein [Bacteroidia bacterium]
MKKSIAIVGGGASALMLASCLDTKKFDVTIYERNFALGRKFLVAGDGGFNLTHSEDASMLIGRYTPSLFFLPLIQKFNNVDFQKWLKQIGIPTYIGTSKRVFPEKGIKPIAVLNAILQLIKQRNVSVKTQHTWKGWASDQQLILNNTRQDILINPDITVFALGGASWKVTGSDGYWLRYFDEKGIATLPFQASNCAVQINWPKSFLDLAEGESLKNVSLSCNSFSKKGEVVITKFGLEGNAIYSLSPEIRKELTLQGHATIFIDLKPALEIEKILKKIKHKGNKSLSKQLENEVNINKLQLSLLKLTLSKEEYTDTNILANTIKRLPLTITGLAPIDEAISTVGGINLSEINEHFELKKLPNHFVIGEMVDWDAPTGGYLLQGCFSFGYALATYLNSS